MNVPGAGGFAEGEIRAACLRQWALRAGHTDDERAIQWCKEQGYLIPLPTPAGMDPMWTFSQEGLDLTDRILAGEGQSIVHL